MRPRAEGPDEVHGEEGVTVEYRVNIYVAQMNGWFHQEIYQNVWARYVVFYSGQALYYHY